ncbi:MAG: polyprenyl synthetase family protein [bacterium]|nr:polyprenyl synthetase family protein [bacterium]MDE0437763.1 polyprenyl synthetase family protein [bacterium]
MVTNVLRDFIDIPQVWERIDRVEERLFEVSTSDDPFLTEIAQHLLAAGGKRFRPVLSQLAAEFGPSRDDRLIEAGTAVELIHVGSLYHDDVIDGAETRRGTVSVNTKWGNAHAILAGDFLIARASELAAISLGLDTVRLLARTYTELVVGQALELRLTGDLAHGPAEHYRVMGGKTASLIRTAARMGALAADAPSRYVEALSVATWELGMVFQITDDALDLVATDEQLGKPAGSDIHQGVYTLPVLRALEGPSGVRISALLAGGMPFAETTVAEVIDLVQEGGYIDEIIDECVNRLDVASEAIASLPDIDARSVLQEMGSFLVKRVRAASG